MARTLAIALIVTVALSSVCAAKTVTADEQRRAVNSAIAQIASENGLQYRCSWLSEPESFDVACDRPAIRVRLHSLKNGNIIVPLEVRCGRTRVKGAWLKVSCEVRKAALVSTRRIARGERITPDAVKLVFVRVEQARGAIDDAAQVVGKKARYSIHSGAVIRPQMLEVPKTVEKGEPLVITYRNGNLLISSIAIALKSANVGCVIPVMNPQSKKTFFARITGRGRAEPIVPTGECHEDD